jgi:hypothetical protein
MMTDLERLRITMHYKQSDIRAILLALQPDASNIADVSATHNLPVEIVQNWYDLSQAVFGAYNLDAYRHSGFVQAQIVA